MGDIISSILSQPDIAKLIIVLISVIILTLLILAFFIIKNFHDIKAGNFFHLTGKNKDNNNNISSKAPISKGADASSINHQEFVDKLILLIEKHDSVEGSTLEIIAKIFVEDNILKVESTAFVDILIEKVRKWCQNDDLECLSANAICTIANISVVKKYKKGKEFIKDAHNALPNKKNNTLKSAIETAQSILIDEKPYFRCY